MSQSLQQTFILDRIRTALATFNLRFCTRVSFSSYQDVPCNEINVNENLIQLFLIHGLIKYDYRSEYSLSKFKKANHLSKSQIETFTSLMTPIMKDLEVSQMPNFFGTASFDVISLSFDDIANKLLRILKEGGLSGSATLSLLGHNDKTYTLYLNLEDTIWVTSDKFSKNVKINVDENLHQYLMLNNIKESDFRILVDVMMEVCEEIDNRGCLSNLMHDYCVVQKDSQERIKKNFHYKDFSEKL